MEDFMKEVAEIKANENESQPTLTVTAPISDSVFTGGTLLITACDDW